MSEANKQQVGGNHYKTTYEHWDLMLNNGMGIDYLIGCATKYVSRWRKKGGIEDLKKALHYVNKLMENIDDSKLPIRNDALPTLVEVGLFATANGLAKNEEMFCFLLMDNQFAEAKEVLLQIIEGYKPSPVPLEDSNKHAERAE